MSGPGTIAETTHLPAERSKHVTLGPFANTTHLSAETGVDITSASADKWCSFVSGGGTQRRSFWWLLQIAQPLAPTQAHSLAGAGSSVCIRLGPAATAG